MENKQSIFDPSNKDIPGYVSEALRSFAQSFQTCIPAIVKKVNSRDSVIVTPAVLQADSEWKSVEWAEIPLSVLTPFGQNVFLSFPVAAGDTGWIVAADLDTSLFKKNKKKPQRQNTFTRHKYQFGFFIPDAINGFSVSNDDAGGIVMSSMDGKTKLVLKADSVKIKSGNSEITAKDARIDINNPGNVYINNINWNQHTHQVPALGLAAPSGGGPVTGTATSQGPQ